MSDYVHINSFQKALSAKYEFTSQLSEIYEFKPNYFLTQKRIINDIRLCNAIMLKTFYDHSTLLCPLSIQTVHHNITNFVSFETNKAINDVQFNQKTLDHLFKIKDSYQEELAKEVKEFTPQANPSNYELVLSEYNSLTELAITLGMIHYGVNVIKQKRQTYLTQAFKRAKKENEQVKQMEQNHFNFQLSFFRGMRICHIMTINQIHDVSLEHIRDEINELNQLSKINFEFTALLNQGNKQVRHVQFKNKETNTLDLIQIYTNLRKQQKIFLSKIILGAEFGADTKSSLQKEIGAIKRLLRTDTLIWNILAERTIRH